MMKGEGKPRDPLRRTSPQEEEEEMIEVNIVDVITVLNERVLHQDAKIVALHNRIAELEKQLLEREK